MSDFWLGWTVRIALFSIPVIVTTYVWIFCYWKWNAPLRERKDAKFLLLWWRYATLIFLGIAAVATVGYFVVNWIINVWEWTAVKTGERT